MNNYAWHDDLLIVLAMVGAIVVLLLRFRLADRKTLASTLLLFGFDLAGQLASGFVFVAGLPQIASGLHEAFLIFEGLAAIRLCGIFALRLLLPTLRLTPPRILEDIVVFIAYIAWGFVRLHYAGLDLSGIITTSAVITAVLAFSMQDTLGNILGGLTL